MYHTITRHLRNFLHIQSNDMHHKLPNIANSTTLLHTAPVDLSVAMQLFLSFNNQALNADECALIILRLGDNSQAISVAHVQSMLILLQNQGKLIEADVLAIKSLQIMMLTHGAEHPDTLRCQYARACLLYHQQQFEQAKQVCLGVLQKQRAILGTVHLDTTATLELLAMICYQQEQIDDAELMLRGVLTIHQEQLGPLHAHTLRTLNHLALLLQKRGQFKQAEAMLKQTLQSQTPQDVLATLGYLAQLYDKQNNVSMCETMYRACYANHQAQLGDYHVDTLGACGALARYLVQQQRCHEAILLLEPAIAAAQATFSPDHFLTAHLQSCYGRCLIAAQKFAEAETCLLSSYGKLQSTFGHIYDKTQYACSALVALYARWGKVQQAAYYRSLSAACS